MTALYCRHCAEPTSGPREADGVCQRCGETIGRLLADGAYDAWAPYTVDWNRLRADEAEERIASMAATAETVDGIAADARRQGAWADGRELASGADAWLRAASALPVAT